MVAIATTNYGNHPLIENAGKQTEGTSVLKQAFNIEQVW